MDFGLGLFLGNEGCDLIKEVWGVGCGGCMSESCLSLLHWEVGAVLVFCASWMRILCLLISRFAMDNETVTLQSLDTK